MPKVVLWPDGVPQGGRSGQTYGDPLVRTTGQGVTFGFGRNPYLYIVAKGPPSEERERHDVI